MERKKIIQLAATVVLVVILLLAVNNAIRASGKRKHRAAVKAASLPGAGPASVDTAGKPLYQIQEEEAGAADLKKDPFAPLVKEEKKAPAPAPVITLTGILWDKDKPLAIINNRVVKIGDTAGGSRVVEIKENSVILNDGTKDFELKLGR